MFCYSVANLQENIFRNQGREAPESSMLIQKQQKVTIMHEPDYQSPSNKNACNREWPRCYARWTVFISSHSQAERFMGFVKRRREDWFTRASRGHQKSTWNGATGQTWGSLGKQSAAITEPIRRNRIQCEQKQDPLHCCSTKLGSFSIGASCFMTMSTSKVTRILKQVFDIQWKGQDSN